jgi:hypothetical protein
MHHPRRQHPLRPPHEGGSTSSDPLSNFWCPTLLAARPCT